MNNADINELRDDLIMLANRGKIRYSEKYIKGAKLLRQLERIKHEYDRKQTEIIDEQISKHIIGGFSSLLKNLEYVDKEECEEMKNTLLNNDMVKKI